MAAHNELGKWGEDMAAAYLQEKGYSILERDWKSGHHDLDIIAQEGNTLVVVEVKTRRNRLFGDRKKLSTTRNVVAYCLPSTTMSRPTTPAVLCASMSSVLSG